MKVHSSLERPTSPLMADLAGLSIGDLAPVRIMGVINVSPESFHPSSVQTTAERIAATAEAMASAGADIIDIGAMSTAPYLKTQISEEEETDRLVHAVETTVSRITIPISVDTQRVKPAAAALASGARIVNDVSGLKRDPNMASLIATAQVGVILMAHEVAPGSGAPMHRIHAALEESLHLAIQAGISTNRTVLDPGIGFFRQPTIPWYEWDCLVLRELASLRTLRLPLLIGVSRKSFIGKLLGKQATEERLVGSLACAAIAVNNGAHIIRTHDVKETLEAVRIAERLRVLWPIQTPLPQ
ncbi:MAG: dihydropteroate synthase [Candidatus Binatia bacterium]